MNRPYKDAPTRGKYISNEMQSIIPLSCLRSWGKSPTVAEWINPFPTKNNFLKRVIRELSFFIKNTLHFLHKILHNFQLMKKHGNKVQKKLPKTIKIRKKSTTFRKKSIDFNVSVMLQYNRNEIRRSPEYPNCFADQAKP